VWKRKKKTEVLSTDPRLGKAGFVTQLKLNNQLNAITIAVPIQSINIWAYAIGVVTRALEKGFFGGATDNGTPWVALQYLITTMESAVRNSVPTTTLLPYTIAAMAQALSSKTIPFGAGQIQYSMVNSAAGVTQTSLLIGYAGYQKYWTIGPASGPQVNGFPSVDISNVPLPPVDIQANALTQMFQLFIQMQTQDATSPFRMVPYQFKTSLKNDVSTYAQVQTQQGVGTTGVNTGGYGVTAKLEVPIFRPLLSTFNGTYLAPSDANRYPTCVEPASGDATFIGASLGFFIPEMTWTTKQYPKFHSVDFLEFQDVMALWVQGLINSYLTDNQTLGGSLGPQQIQLVQCPLTLQELGLLLRNQLMCAFKDTQAAVQGLLPVQPSGATDNQFTPYIAGSGSCFLASTAMLLPVPLVENIRALTARHIQKTEYSQEWFIPVLGQYVFDVLNPADYVCTYTDGGDQVVVLPAFKPASAVYQRTIRDSKGKSTVLPMAEVPINFIDGSTGSGYIAINDPKQLEKLTTMWNTWLTDSGLQTFSVPMGPLGTEPGINVLCSVAMTRYWIDASDQEHQLKRIKAEDGVVDLRNNDPRRRSVLASPYANRECVQDSSQGVILSAPYEQIQKTWILPVVILEYISQEENTISQRWQALMKEPYSASRTGGDTGAKMSELHATYAKNMQKSKLAATSTWSSLFADMAAKGRGGILSGLVASLVGNVFPAASGIVNTIANVLPI